MAIENTDARPENASRQRIKFRQPFVPTLAEKIAKELIRVRIENDLTQKEFAEVIGTSQAAVSRAESGGWLPSLRYLDKIARNFDVQLIVEFRAKQVSLREFSWDMAGNIIPFPVDRRASCALAKGDRWETPAPVIAETEASYEVA